jgi:Xaa-Pro aminopeptidase
MSAPKRHKAAGSKGAERLAALRAELARRELDAFIVPSDDPHQSEYVSACYERRAFISGFKGSSGTALVTAKEALLWTDARYFLQATDQLFEGWTLMKDRLPETIPLEVWLADCGHVKTVGLDPLLVSASELDELREALGAVDKSVHTVRDNPVDLVWGSDRPPPPSAPAFALEETVAGMSVADKLQAMEEELEREGADTLVVAALDEVAWLFNVRGADIDFCPVSYAYATVHRGQAHAAAPHSNGGEAQAAAAHSNGTKSGAQPARTLRARWYIDKAKVSAELLARVRASAGPSVSVELRNYLEIVPCVQEEAAAGKVVLIPASASAALHELVPKSQRKALVSPISMPKALKNDAEVAGMREAHLRDARALSRFLAWLEATDAGGSEGGNDGSVGGVRVDEVQAAERLEAFRKMEAGYVGPSFETISAFGANGAIIHYKPEPDTCARLSTDSLFLLDSGGQYTCGTTDVTRTVHLRPAQASEHMRACWTRVLRAHIAVDTAVFPTGVTGYQLDAIARAPLWQAGLDYRHGTGHGVGAFLNVHEGPHGMSLTRISTNSVGLQPGMTLSNEPGKPPPARPPARPPVRPRAHPACPPVRRAGTPRLPHRPAKPNTCPPAAPRAHAKR